MSNIVKVYELYLSAPRIGSESGIECPQWVLRAQCLDEGDVLFSVRE